jgi:CheY-like chemotaxis protein
LIVNVLRTTGVTIDECSTGKEAVELYEAKRHDCVLMEIEMKEMDGLTATKLITSSNPRARVVIVTEYKDDYFSNAACEAGAFAFVGKDNLSAVRDIVRQEKRRLAMRRPRPAMAPAFR